MSTSTYPIKLITVNKKSVCFYCSEARYYEEVEYIYATLGSIKVIIHYIIQGKDLSKMFSFDVSEYSFIGAGRKVNT